MNVGAPARIRISSKVVVVNMTAGALIAVFFPAPSEPASLAWKKIQTQFSPPDERSCGIIIEGARAVAENQLHVRDHAGQTWVVPLNGDPDVQARRLLREKFGKHHAFNAPIHYPPRSYH
jgi:hypothetical protein